MKIRYAGFLLSDATAQLRRIPLPEPPSAEETARELAGIERLLLALNDTDSLTEVVL